ncbi:hypothetical protein GCM10010174_63880 [Kutzneria viridogrisea]|uniref:Ribosomal protein S12 methylthiotransferase accessory factor n=1 Tax=Kutzneria viridogrisea TaxID=47990 RepID=A0ABR6BGK8_9PSEU|nr:ribosomal protein S12 methylthiotransferase accessory factor [Kutzneria viridogrisea]
MRTASATLLERAVGWRQGVVRQLHEVPTTPADVPVGNWAAISDYGTSGGAGSGGRLAALAEALERHAAASCPLESQTPPAGAEVWDFSLRTKDYTQVWTLPGNEPVWVPTGLVGLSPEFGMQATSSGLAAAPSTEHALLRALQELVERDAFTVTWLHGVAARRVETPEELARPVAELGGEITVFDLTPAYSPHPVAAVAGTLPIAGRPRPTLGLACRGDWGEAVRKAWLEWCQGTVFVSVWSAEHAELALSPEQVTDFERHAGYYWSHLDQWRRLPLWGGPLVTPSPSCRDDLTTLVSTLDANGVRAAYRELTTPELSALGLRAVRVLSPDLTPLHSDHRRPWLGGRTGDLMWRYPWARTARVYPNPNPHPLG